MQHLINASYRRLQRETGINASQWFRYIKYRKSMTEATLRRVADRLGVTPAEILAFLEYRREMAENKGAEADANWRQYLCDKIMEALS